MIKNLALHDIIFKLNKVGKIFNKRFAISIREIKKIYSAFKT